MTDIAVTPAGPEIVSAPPSHPVRTAVIAVFLSLLAVALAVPMLLGGDDHSAAQRDAAVAAVLASNPDFAAIPERTAASAEQPAWYSAVLAADGTVHVTVRVASDQGEELWLYEVAPDKAPRLVSHTQPGD